MACLTRLNHKNIIKLREIIDDPSSERVYLVMDYCEGGTLKEKLEETESGLPEDEVRRYFRSLLSALHYCHEVWNIAHRDVKPENIMLKSRTDEDIVLCDFGCSEFFQPKSDRLSKATKGTYLFMAPEFCKTGISEKVVRGR